MTPHNYFLHGAGNRQTGYSLEMYRKRKETFPKRSGGYGISYGTGEMGSSDSRWAAGMFFWTFEGREWTKKLGIGETPLGFPLAERVENRFAVNVRTPGRPSITQQSLLC